MGLEASLKLLDLSPDATIDDANQAYATLHQMIDRYHQATPSEDRGNRQEDIDLLTGAYEKAVTFFTDRDQQPNLLTESGREGEDVANGLGLTDLQFTINLSTQKNEDTPATQKNEDVPAARENEEIPELIDAVPHQLDQGQVDLTAQTVSQAISTAVTHLEQTKSELPGAQKETESTQTDADAAHQRLQAATSSRIHAVGEAKLAKATALLLDVEAKRAMDEAMMLAKKARRRVKAARQAATVAHGRADEARKKVKGEEIKEAAAKNEATGAELCLEKAKLHLKTLIHSLVENRRRIAIFQETETGAANHAENAVVDIHPPIPVPCELSPIDKPVDQEESARQQIMSDLLEIEASLKVKDQDSDRYHSDPSLPQAVVGHFDERRHHPRIVYPPTQRPSLSFDGHTFSILDLSTAGMGLKSDSAMVSPRIVRGMITFPDWPPVNVTGKVVRRNGNGFGLRLATRIGRHILDQERCRIRVSHAS